MNHHFNNLDFIHSMLLRSGPTVAINPMMVRVPAVYKPRGFVGGTIFSKAWKWMRQQAPAFLRKQYQHYLPRIQNFYKTNRDKLLDKGSRVAKEYLPEDMANALDSTVRRAVTDAENKGIAAAEKYAPVVERKLTGSGSGSRKRRLDNTYAALMRSLQASKKPRRK
jgi:hypothetical protein